MNQNATPPNNASALLRELLVRKISFETRMKIADYMRDMEDDQREKSAEQILFILSNSKTEMEFVCEFDKIFK